MDKTKREKLEAAGWMAILVLGLFPVAYGQDYNNVDRQRLLQEWIKGTRLPSGVISVRTMKRATKFDPEANVTVTFVDLDSDGREELAIQSNCAPVGNCALEIYKKTGRHYRKILATDMVQTIKVLPVGHGKYNDLKLGTHDSAVDTYYRIFVYSGTRYKQLRCWLESYSYIDKNGNVHELKKPIIKKGCESGD